MNSNVISGSLVYKGETGLSAYEIAVQHGFEGTEQDWLRSLGTSSMFNQYKTTDTGDGTTTKFDLPEEYSVGGFVDVYVDGLHVLDTDYEIVEVEGNEATYQVEFDTAPANGKVVELITTLISTQNLPISESINNTSTNETASGTKAVYDYIEALFSRIYPVGSIYMSVNSTNPSTLFGGTWVSWGSGRVPVGIDTSDNDFDTAEEIGGEKRHTLSISEMPRHNHTLQSVSGEEYVSNLHVTSRAHRTGDSFIGELDTWAESNPYHSMTISYVGSSSSHNNLQPYITCYMWKRTA